MDESLIEATAVWLAQRINGGSFYEPQWYTHEQRELWRGHARALLEQSPVARRLEQESDAAWAAMKEPWR